MTDETPPIIAVVDEAAPADRGGICYLVTAALLLEPNRARAAVVDEIASDRIRPFHWAHEGTQARERMLGVLKDGAIVAHVVVHYPTRRRRQEEARRSAMSELVPLVISDGAKELIIESRSAREDQRDRQSVIEAIHRAGRAIPYRWETKTEPLLWVADAVCEVVKEYLLGDDVDGLQRL